MAGGGDRIGVKVKGQDGEEVFFTVRRTSRLRKLMEEYARGKSLAANSLVFLYDGAKITADHTAKALEMEDGDTISAMLHQTGGGPGGEGRLA
ncbi:unnamed protein product [Alopecurus aequalis]